MEEATGTRDLECTGKFWNGSGGWGISDCHHRLLDLRYNIFVGVDGPKPAKILDSTVRSDPLELLKKPRIELITNYKTHFGTAKPPISPDQDICGDFPIMMVQHLVNT